MTNISVADISALIKEANKEVGEEVAISLDKGASANIGYRVDSGSSLLNCVMSGSANGGYPGGRIVEILASESVGKTTIAAQAISNVQKVGGIGIFIDTEHAFDEDRMKQLKVDKSRLIYADPDHMEQALSLIEALLTSISKKHKDLPVIVVWDSVAGTPAKAELEGEYDQQFMGLHARILSQGFRKIGKIINTCNATLICINQAKSSIGGYIAEVISLGGKAVKFHSSTRMYLTKGEAIMEGTVQVGHYVRVKTIKNKVFRPLLEIDVPLLYESGLNNELGWFKLFSALGIIRSAGGWYYYTMTGKEEIAFRGSEWLEKLKDPSTYSYFKGLINNFDILTKTFNNENSI